MRKFLFERLSADHADRSIYYLNAYAVSVDRGSEAGVGFSWFRELARRYHVVLFTEAEFRESLMAWIERSPEISCAVHFFDIGQVARARCWNQGDWRFYWSYWLYQIAVFRQARRALKVRKPAILHQLNMIGFREPGYFWLLSLLYGVPLVWGPVGGYNLPAPSFFDSYGVVARVKQAVKNALNVLSLLLPSVIGSFVVSKVLLLAIPPRGRLMTGLMRAGTLFPETFVSEDMVARADAQRRETRREASPAPTLKVRAAMVGRLVPRKLVDIAIEAVSKLSPDERARIEVNVIGDGPVRGVLESLCVGLGVAEQFIFRGPTTHAEALARIEACDVLVHCSVDEGTSHAVVEALGLGKPVVAFDCSGHSIIAKSAGISLLPYPRTRGAAARGVANALRELLRGVTHGSRTADSLGVPAEWTGPMRIRTLCQMLACHENGWERRKAALD